MLVVLIATGIEK